MKRIILSMAAIALLVSACSNEKKADTETDTTTMTDSSATTSSKYHYEMKWEAFKTPKKVGVHGSFTDIKLDSTKDQESKFTGILEGAVFNVNVMSVNSADPIRDQNLKTNFFSKLMGNINGKFGKFNAGTVPVQITLAGTTKQINLKYQDMGDSLKVNGTIDLIKDFKANKALESIAEACKTFHEGKTWSDVNISGTIKK